jgi:hypothetical protein
MLRAGLSAALVPAWLACCAAGMAPPAAAALLPPRNLDVASAAEYYSPARNKPGSGPGARLRAACRARACAPAACAGAHRRAANPDARAAWRAAAAARRAAAAAPAPTRADIQAATALLAAARDAASAGEYAAALESYTAVAERYPGLALSHAARLSAALLLFQTGARERALLELESESADVGLGNAQLHAALAVVLHATRPAQLARAEAEWDAALALAPRYDDADWVRHNKAWPPALLDALRAFITLS